MGRQDFNHCGLPLVGVNLVRRFAERHFTYVHADVIRDFQTLISKDHTIYAQDGDKPVIRPLRLPSTSSLSSSRSIKASFP